MTPEAQAFDFGGKRALVTGGSRGFGGVLSRRLAALGAHVFINYLRDDVTAERTAGGIKATGGSATLVKANLVHAAEIDSMFERVADAGHLDILIHNAALGTFKPTLEVRSNQWDLSMAVNTRALLLCAQKAAPLMKGRPGRIVSMSSLGSGRVMPSYGAIGPSKAALEALTRYLAAELWPREITVNVVSAGLIAGTSIAQHPFHDALLSKTGAADPDDVAAVVLFLCSPLAKWITGQTIVADGGFSLGV